MNFPVSRPAAMTSLALAIAFAYTPSAFAEGEGALADIIVTATRTPQAASEVLSDTVTIGAEEIARSGADSLTDLLARQRGIEVARNGGGGSNASVFMRGANSNQNVVLVDGVRIGSSTTGAANWSAIPLSSIDHVEIVYGPLSTLYGADAIGGVIQIFTKTGSGAPRLSANVGAGSEATRAYDATVSGATAGEHKFSYSISAGKEQSDGFSATKPGNYSYNGDDDGYTRESANGRLGLELAKGQDLGLVFMKSKLDAQYDNGSDSYDARSVQKLENIAVFSNNRIGANWTSQLQAAQAKDKSNTDGGSESYDKSRLDTKQTEYTWQNDFRLGSDNLQILLGYRKEEVSSSDTPELAQSRDTKSVAANYSLKRGQHQFNIGARNDDSSVYGSNTTGSLAYGYMFSKALRATASYGTSFRAPTYNELYYPQYGVATNKPEKGRNAEAGLHYEQEGTQLNAVYYHNRLTDMLVSTTTCPILTGDYPYGCAYNVNRATLEGLTLSARQQLGALNLSGNIDLQDPRDDTTGKQLVRRAKRHATFAADYTTGPLTGGVEWQVSSQRYDNAANTSKLGGYGLVNLYATYQLAPEWSVLVRWNNVADKHYELAGNYGTAGSSLFAALRYSMK
jgi:vitamin B12 transporter